MLELWCYIFIENYFQFWTVWINEHARLLNLKQISTLFALIPSSFYINFEEKVSIYKNCIKFSTKLKALRIHKLHWFSLYFLTFAKCKYPPVRSFHLTCLSEIIYYSTLLVYSILSFIRYFRVTFLTSLKRGLHMKSLKGGTVNPLNRTKAV